jgi:hypothetical protein
MPSGPKRPMMERIQGQWRTALGLWRRHGAGALFSVAAEKLKRGGIVLHLFGLADPIALQTAAWAASIKIHDATRQEVERFCAEEARDWDGLAALDEGDRCLMQTLDGRCAGLVWMSTRPVVELLPGVRIRVPNDAVYSYRTWTEPSFRGYGLQGLRHRAVLEAARPQGRTRLLLFVGSTKFESLKGVHRSGCTQIGSVRIRTGGKGVSFTVAVTDPAWSSVVGVPHDVDPEIPASSRSA